VLDHVLIAGPPGLGKTTLAQIIATEMGTPLTATAAPTLEKTGDLAAILTSLAPHSILFIDEIHRLRPVLEEILYSAMEDFKLDIIIGQGPGARSVKIDLSPFTLIGATTRPGMLSSPLQTRFGIDIFMDFYTHKDLHQILLNKAAVLNIHIAPKASLEIGKRSRGTPRILQKLLKRVHDFSIVKNEKEISLETVQYAMQAMQINEDGLTINDLKLLKLMYENYRGGPVGLSTLAVALGDSEDSIEDIYEPFLIREGFIQKTPRGRVFNKKKSFPLLRGLLR
jgi:Holliday junction DNA helicase RuvB